MTIHRVRHLLVQYVNRLREDELPDPSVVIEVTKPVQGLFQYMHDAANQAMAGKQKDIVQLNFDMLEETALAYMSIALRYGQALKQAQEKARRRK